jgi:hypothetical protein
MSDQTQQLPGELAARLTRLAETRTADSRPWPRVDQAVRRSHRRRVAGVSALAAAGVLVAVAAAGGLLSPSALRSAPVAPAAPTAARAPKTLSEAGLTGAVGGSLAGDTAWQAALRDRVIALSGSQGQAAVASRKDVLVLWAGDLNGQRYAVVDFRTPRSAYSNRPRWNSTVLQGPAGAPANSMMMSESSASSAAVPSTPDATFYPGTVFVTAPLVEAVQIASARRFSPTGQVSTTWRSLQKQGDAVWVGQLSPAELYLADYRVLSPGDKGEDDGSGNRGGSSSPANTRPAKVAGMATAGTDLLALADATNETSSLGASAAEQPVLAAGLTLKVKDTLAATVLRSPDNGYLFGVAERVVQDTAKKQGFTMSAGAISRQAFADPNSFMAAVKLETRSHYVVIAPAGAVTVRRNGFSAVVHNRLAVLPIAPSDPDTPIAVEALDANGKQLAVVHSITVEETEHDFGPGQG